MKDKYENMSVDEIYKQVLQNRPVSSGIGWLGKFAIIVPYLIAICVMIISDHWMTLLVSTIIVHVNGAHAASIGDMGAKLFFNKLADWFYELWIKTMQISGIVIVTILIVFIVYHTLYRHVHIYHYYGRIRKHASNRTNSWYVILPTVVKQNRLFWQHEHLVVLAIETDYNGDRNLYTPDSKSIWLKKSLLTLMQPIEVHFKDRTIGVVTVNVELKDKEIKWNNDHEFVNFDSFHGQMVDVTLTKLVN